MMHGKETKHSTAEQGRQETTAPQPTSDTIVEALTRNSAEKTQYAIPIGIADFRTLRTTLTDGAPYWFADKSLFVKSITGSGAEITLITRPRRFGKTLNMSMLECFFNIKDAEKNRKLFEGLAITKDQNAMQHQGRYPVVSVSFKGIGADKYAEQIDEFKTYMSKVYRQHYYLLDQDTCQLVPEEITFFKNVCSGAIEEARLPTTLEQLTVFLSKHYQKKVVVLVDEYDNPLLWAFDGGFEKNFRKFYRKLIGGALKDNPAVYKGVLTGIVQIAGGGLFSEFNNPDISNILNDRHADYFGLNENEIKKLLRDTHHDDRFDEVSEWYNGYLFGEGGLVIYNPWSALQYIHNCAKPTAYWAYTSDNRLLQTELLGANEPIKERLMMLMQSNGKLVVDLKTHLRFDEMGVSKEQSLWVLLLSSGYLKAKFQGLYGAKCRIELSIPNKEIQFVYAEIFEDWLKDRANDIKHHPETLLTLLKSGQIASFCQTLEQFFLASVSLHDTRRDNIETFYHGFVLALLGLMNTTHIGTLRSNHETGLGRSDITFEPKDKTKDVGIVVELKRLSANTKRKKKSTIKNQLKRSAKEGFEQITDRAYSQDLIDRGVQRIAWISLAFSGKQMAYQYREPAPVDQLERPTIDRPVAFKRARLAIDDTQASASIKHVPHLFKQHQQSIDQHWYTDDEINQLLQYYLNGMNQVAVMDGIALEQHAGGTLAQNLQQLELQLAELEAFADVPTPTIVVPIHLGNQHWAGLYIHHHDQAGNREQPHIGYFDPLGQLMPRQLKNILKKRYPNSQEKDYLESPIQLQNDGYNCGPWVVEILRELVHSKRLPPDDFDIGAARLRHHGIVVNQATNTSAQPSMTHALA